MNGSPAWCPQSCKLGVIYSSASTKSTGWSQGWGLGNGACGPIALEMKSHPQPGCTKASSGAKAAPTRLQRQGRLGAGSWPEGSVWAPCGPRDSWGQSRPPRLQGGAKVPGSQPKALGDCAGVGPGVQSQPLTREAHPLLFPSAP